MNIAQKLRLPDAPWTVAVIGGQWGDEGKGHIVDGLAEEADIIARGTGGANAGHTIVANGETIVLHLITSGILHDGKRKLNLIGSGVALDPKILCEELDLLASRGLSYDYLRIAWNAHLVLPQHLVMDRIKEALAGKGKIGTTGRGIGPVYIDRVGRIGLNVVDLLNPDIFIMKLRKNLEDKLVFLREVQKTHPEIIQQVMEHPDLGSGQFYDSEAIFNIQAIVNQYGEYAERLRGMVCDTDRLVREAVGSKKILLEGAQGVLLSVACGIHPHVTSSDASLMGLAQGVGLRENQIDRTFLVVKAFYMTRVGEGVFPTELGGEVSAAWCGRKGLTAEIEAKEIPNASVNNRENPLRQGIAIRRIGQEFGSTTGRPRRVGWLDLPLLRLAAEHAGTEVILTKLDILDDCEVIPVCTGHLYEGPDYQMGDRTLWKRTALSTAVPLSEVLGKVLPIYDTHRGWLQKLGDIRDVSGLPQELLDIVRSVEKLAQVKVVALSVGPDREQIIGL